MFLEVCQRFDVEKWANNRKEKVIKKTASASESDWRKDLSNKAIGPMRVIQSSQKQVLQYSSGPHTSDTP
jgi:hypothetical protein